MTRKFSLNKDWMYLAGQDKIVVQNIGASDIEVAVVKDDKDLPDDGIVLEQKGSFATETSNGVWAKSKSTVGSVVVYTETDGEEPVVVDQIGLSMNNSYTDVVTKPNTNYLLVNPIVFDSLTISDGSTITII